MSRPTRKLLVNTTFLSTLMGIVDDVEIAFKLSGNAVIGKVSYSVLIPKWLIRRAVKIKKARTESGVCLGGKSLLTITATYRDYSLPMSGDKPHRLMKISPAQYCCATIQQI